MEYRRKSYGQGNGQISDTVSQLLEGMEWTKNLRGNFPKFFGEERQEIIISPLTIKVTGVLLCWFLIYTSQS